MPIIPMSDAAWHSAKRMISRGDLVAFPTDTVYGLACDPYNAGAIQRIYRAKGRGVHKALPLLLADVYSMYNFADNVPQLAALLARTFWPGALTLVVPRRSSLPDVLGQGSTIGVRVPDHAHLRSLIQSCGGALAATSANLSGEPDALTAQQVEAYLGDTVQLIIDGGPSPGALPSTVVDCTADPPAILRAGFLSEEIRRVLERGK